MEKLANTNGCKNCIEYKLNHNQIDNCKCLDCGNDTMVWKQEESGTFYVECSYCGTIAAVDLNTPCEEDKVFWQEIKIIIEPNQGKISNRDILDLAKFFNYNGVQMRNKLCCGFSAEATFTHGFDDIIDILQQKGINYKVVKPDDPRKKYPYYKYCKYPYSPFRHYNIERDKFD